MIEELERQQMSGPTRHPASISASCPLAPTHITSVIGGSLAERVIIDVHDEWYALGDEEPPKAHAALEPLHLSLDQVVAKVKANLLLPSGENDLLIFHLQGGGRTAAGDRIK